MSGLEGIVKTKNKMYMRNSVYLLVQKNASHILPTKISASGNHD